jgi:hypothetical protein
VVEAVRFFLGEGQDAPGPFRELVKSIGHSFLLARAKPG